MYMNLQSGRPSQSIQGGMSNIDNYWQFQFRNSAWQRAQLKTEEEKEQPHCTVYTNPATVNGHRSIRNQEKEAWPHVPVCRHRYKTTITMDTLSAVTRLQVPVSILLCIPFFTCPLIAPDKDQSDRVRSRNLQARPTAISRRKDVEARRGLSVEYSMGLASQVGSPRTDAIRQIKPAL